MRKQLKKILEPEMTITRYGTVSERISARRFRVKDDNDFEFFANADTDWGLGAKVIVQNGFIIGTGARSGTYKHYKI